MLECCHPKKCSSGNTVSLKGNIIPCQSDQKYHCHDQWHAVTVNAVINEVAKKYLPKLPEEERIAGKNVLLKFVIPPLCSIFKGSLCMHYFHNQLFN